MTTQELKDVLVEQEFVLRKAKTRGMMVRQEQERLQNLLMNNIGEILSAIDLALEAEEKIQRLTVEIESADSELRDMDDEIAKLKTENETLKAKGKKKPDVQ